LYPEAGVVDGRVVDIKVSATSPYVGKGTKNGVVGTLGRLNLKAGKSVSLDFQILDSTTGIAVSVDVLSLTFLDIDEGKKGKARASVTACGAQQFVSNPSELTLTADSTGRCSTATSSVAGTKADNPSSVEAALTSDVASKRIASYVFEAASTFSVTLDLAKGYGYRGFMFALVPGAACSDDANLPAECVAALDAEEDLAPASMRRAVASSTGMGQSPNIGMGQRPNMGMGQRPNMGMGMAPNMGRGMR